MRSKNNGLSPSQPPPIVPLSWFWVLILVAVAFMALGLWQGDYGESLINGSSL